MEKIHFGIFELRPQTMRPCGFGNTDDFASRRIFRTVFESEYTSIYRTEKQEFHDMMDAMRGLYLGARPYDKVVSQDARNL